MKYTPGPWKQSGSTIYSESEGVAIAIMANRATNTADVRPLDLTPRTTWDAAMQDARLIAAAPDLLEALRLVEKTSGTVLRGDVWDAVLAAIRKVTA